MITRLKLSTIEQGLPKYRSMLAGNAAYDPYAFVSIATVSVGSGGASTVEFTSIPSTYTHLQIRALGRMTNSGTSTGTITMRFNTDTSSNYNAHRILGENGTVYAQNQAASYVDFVGQWTLASSTASVFGVTIIDILDYANTNKYKTIRSLNGSEGNSTSISDVALSSGLWRSTSAIDTIKFSGTNFSGGLAEYSHFALYGIKVAS